jgi:hypothetical protein
MQLQLKLSHWGFVHVMDKTSKVLFMYIRIYYFKNKILNIFINDELDN